MDRGVSTVLDVGLACILVTASATLLVPTAPPTADANPPDADRVGRALLPSTVTIETSGHTVETSVGDLLVDAARVGDLTKANRRTVRNRTLAVHPHTQIHVTPRGEHGNVTVGPSPPPGVPVDAAVFKVGISTNSAGPGQHRTVVIVVRTWSA